EDTRSNWRCKDLDATRGGMSQGERHRAEQPDLRRPLDQGLDLAELTRRALDPEHPDSPGPAPGRQRSDRPAIAVDAATPHGVPSPPADEVEHPTEPEVGDAGPVKKTQHDCGQG